MHLIALLGSYMYCCKLIYFVGNSFILCVVDKFVMACIMCSGQMLMICLLCCCISQMDISVEEEDEELDFCIVAMAHYLLNKERLPYGPRRAPMMTGL